MAEWDPALLRLISRNHRLILVDYPGVGLSSGRTPASFSAMADQVASFLSAAGYERVDVLGWSMGGFVAQRLALQHPEKVRALVLAGTNPGGPRTVLGSADEQRSDSDPDRSDREVLRELYPLTRAGQREGRAFLRRLELASQSGEIPDDFSVPRASQARQVKAEDPWLRSGRNFRELARLRIPVLAAAGRVDRITPPANMRLIASRSGGRYQVFAGSHAFLFSDRQAFSSALERFLKP